LSEIKKVKMLNVNERNEFPGCFVSPLGSNKNILLEFKRPIKFSGTYFTSKTRTKALIALDHPLKLLNKLADNGIEVA